MQEGLLEAEFYSDFIYKFRKIVGKTDFRNNGKKLSLVQKHMLQHRYFTTKCMHSCIPFMVDNFASYFNCTTARRSIE